MKYFSIVQINSDMNYYMTRKSTSFPESW